MINANLNIIGSRIIGGGSSTGSTPSFIEPTPPSSDLILKFNLYELSSMFQERAISPSGVPVTPVATNTNPIGTILDQSLATRFLRATSGTALPTLTISGVTFDGTTDRLELPTSTVYLKKLHAPNTVWSLRFWVRKGLDGVARPLMCNQTLSATQNGFYIQLTAANRVRFFLGDGVAPAMVDFTSATSLTVANGATPIQIVVSGSSSKMVIGSTTETFNVVSGGGTANANLNLSIGSDGSTFFTGSLSKSIEFFNRALTNQEIIDYQSFNPLVTTTDFTPIKQWGLDFNDNTNIFSNTGETVTITNGGFIRSIKSKIGLPYYPEFIRKATSSSNAASPLWRQSERNGRSTAEFDGTGTQILTYSEDLWPEVGGTSTFFIVIKNDDASFGSHFVNGNPEYGTMTGNQYTANLGNTGSAGQPYTTQHHGGAGGSGTGPLGLISRSNDYNIICVRRKGGTGSVITQNKIVNTLSNFGRYTSTLIGQAAPAGVPQWHTDGHVALIEKYVGYFTDQQVFDKIEYLKYLYSINGNLN